MAIPTDASKYMTIEEYNALWSIENLHHYLTHSASTLSQAPMDMASALLTDMMETMDQAVKGSNEYAVMLRFGHAETMMPLLIANASAGMLLYDKLFRHCRTSLA